MISIGCITLAVGVLSVTPSHGPWSAVGFASVLALFAIAVVKAGRWR